MSSRSFFTKVKDELGIAALAHAPRDTYILLLTRTLRMFAFGVSTMILAVYFHLLELSDSQIGLFMTLTLIGDVFVSLALTFVTDGLGRRRMLLLGSVLMIFSGVVFATTSSYWFLLFAAVVGVISPSGNEIGPFRAIEESTLAHLTPDADRSDIFAWYVVVGTLGSSAGAVVSGWMTQGLMNSHDWEWVDVYRLIFWLYAFIGLIKFGATFLLSSRCEIQSAAPQQPQARDSNDDEEAESLIDRESNRASVAQREQQQQPLPKAAPTSRWELSQISPSSRKTLLKLCSLFAIDSLASGMVPMSLISYYLIKKFSALDQAALGYILASAWFVSSIGNILASSVSKRIGFVHTMVFTHLPSAVFLALTPAPHSLALTVVFLVLRSSLASMDQAPRSAFLSAVVLPAERTAVMGVVNTVKTCAQSGGPLITGFLAQGERFGVAFVVAGALKASYDLGLLYIFSETKGRKNGDDQLRAARIGVVDDDDEDEEEGMELRSTRRT